MEPTAALAETRRLSVRLARSDADLEAVQHLRWLVFFEEMSSSEAPLGTSRLDVDSHDALCDHLLVVDQAADGGERVVGTYRLLRESVARRAGGFYSAGEFDISPLTIGEQRPDGELLELGRSCVLAPYRTSATISLLWRAIADYIERNHIGLLFGCASFPGTRPQDHALALSWLFDCQLAEAHQRPVALDRHAMDWRLAPGSYDPRAAMQALPPLIKGYLRCGAKVGEGLFVDHDFNTVDVAVVMPVEAIARRYAARFSGAA